MDPVTARFLLLHIGRWWMKVRPFSREKRKMKTQFFQGGLTFAGLGVAGLSWLLDNLELTTPVCAAVNVVGCNSAFVATFLIGLAMAVWGRVRRELRAE